MLSIKPPFIIDSKNDKIFKKYYTIQSEMNKAMTIRINDKTQLVAFRDFDDAYHISRMIETHIIYQNEWPDFHSDKLVLPEPKNIHDLNHVYIQNWDFDDLKVECTRNNLNMITVNGINDHPQGLSFIGEMLTFSAPVEFYMSRFNELME